MTTAVDIATMLPESIRKKFEAHYAKQDPITWELAEGCSRCGSFCYSSGRTTHELWHKNVSCQLWMLSQWPIEHTQIHEIESTAFQAVIASILGFIDPEGEQDPEAHAHEDGTTHAH